MTSSSKTSPIGKPKSHDSAIGHVTGNARYTDEQRHPAGMLTAMPLMSSHAHAKIKSIDVSQALAVQGCVTVITAKEIPGVNDTGVVIHDEPLLPTDTVNYYGQAIAWAVAETPEVARKAVALIQVEYEPLEPILTIEAAISANQFHGQPTINPKMQRGNVSSAIAQAEHLINGKLEINGQDHFYLETQTSWVIPDGEGNYQVYSSTQHPSETQVIVARVLGIASNQVVVTCLRMGGGFGGKESQANPPAAIAAIAAYKTGRPVRIKLDRQQDMHLTGKRHGFLAEYEVGFDNHGKISALDVSLYADGGWSLDLSAAILSRAMFHIDNAYYIPNITVQGKIAKTHKASNTAFRGFGGPQGMVFIEEIIDRIARRLDLPPEVVRKRNFYHGSGETNTTHYGQEITDNRIQRVWQEGLARSGFHDRQPTIATFNETHTYTKRGLAITPVKFGISFTKKEYNQAGALVLIYADGTIQLNHGGTEMGQGLQIKMLQVAAQALGVKLDRIRIMPPSTDKVPNTSATAASSGSDLNGQAVKAACEELKSRLIPVAETLLGIENTALVFADDRIYPANNPDHRITFETLIQQAYNDRISLSSTGYYRTPHIHWDAETARGNPFYYFAYGVAISEVEVDGLTGTFKLRQVDIVHDVGNSLNPLIDRGQIEGGFVQGMGWMTMEELIWDEQGKLRTDAPSTYKIPTISEIPEQFTIHLLDRAAQDGVIYGSKAVGEPPFMLAIAVREAIRAAVAAFGSCDHIPLALPATPEATLRAIAHVRAAS
jgi:xanthine dehydrogenase large subunit